MKLTQALQVSPLMSLPMSLPRQFGVAAVIALLPPAFPEAAQATVSVSEIRVIEDEAYRVDADSPDKQKLCRLDWYLPPEPAPNCPTLVWFHGGGLRGGDKADEIASAVARRFAGDGMIVASVNYRLSPQVRYPAYVDDAAAAVAHVCRRTEQLGGNRESVFISGHSAGGYLTAMVGLHPELLPKYGVSRDSIAGLIPVSGQMITHSTVRSERDIPRSRPLIDSAAPLYFVADSAPPMLCIAGSDDLPARAEENRYFAAAMTAAGHDRTEYREFPGRDHGTIANRMGQPDDAVATAITDFIRSAR